MSYDIKLCAKIEGTDIYARVAEPEISKPSHNMRSLFVTSMEWNYKQGDIYKCKDVVKYAENGIFNMLNNSNIRFTFGTDNIVYAITVLSSLLDCIKETSKEIPIEHLYMRW